MTGLLRRYSNRMLTGNVETGLEPWPVYGKETNTMIFSGYGSTVQPDNDRTTGINYIIDNILLDGAA